MALDPLSIVTDFALVMGAAAIISLLFHRVGLPAAPGFIIAGLFLNILSQRYDIIQTLSTIDVLSQIGMVLLFFSIGLQFSIRKLRDCGLIMIFIGILEVGLCLTAGYWVGIALGWSEHEAMALGGVISISSTVVVMSSIERLGERWAPYRSLIIGILIVEDALAVIIISFFSTAGGGGIPSLNEVFLAGLEIVLFVLFVFVIGMYLVPSVLDKVVTTRRTEMLTMTALGLCFATAALAGRLGLSPSIGAFAMGIIIGGSTSLQTIDRSIGSIRDFFVALFFMTIGFYVTPEDLLAAVPLALLVVGIFVLIKFLSCTIASLFGGRDMGTALRLSVSMLAIGEFSIVIAQVSMGAGLVDKPLLAVVVLATLITSAILPSIMTFGDRKVASGWKEEPGGIMECTHMTAGWLDHISNRISKDLRRAASAFAVKMAVSVLMVALSLIILRTVVLNTGPISDATGLGSPIILGIALGLVISVLLVQAVVMARRINRFTELLARRIVGSSETAEAMGKRVVVHLIRNVTGAALAIGLMLILTFFIRDMLPIRTVLWIGVMALFVIIAWLVGDSLHILNRRIEKVVHRSLSEEQAGTKKAKAGIRKRP